MKFSIKDFFSKYDQIRRKLLTENELISHHQSGFKPIDSCISQLLCITQEIYWSLDDGLETRAVFLNISKAFNKVWHGGLIFKLKRNGISGNHLNLSPIFCIRENKVLFYMDSTRLGLMLKQGSPRDLILDHYSFWSISMTYLMAWLQIQNYLRMTPLCFPLFKI